jgi:small subunit ribosomal protein S17|tara:strand:+ start:180 stop:473 length:294 start_codon:yes stop_codon:yes gene_type:complete
MSEEANTAPEAKAPEAKKTRKGRRGEVVSKSGDKSIVVQVERRKQHPVYGKVIRMRRKFHVHDEKNEANVGDHVRIVECRPISRLKRFRLAAIERTA